MTTVQYVAAPLQAKPCKPSKLVVHAAADVLSQKAPVMKMALADVAAAGHGLASVTNARHMYRYS